MTASGPAMLTLVFVGRPPLVNWERSVHWTEHRSSTASYRAEAALRAGRHARTPMEVVEVRSWPRYRTRRSWPDVGAWMPATKAAIDGLVDAGVLPGDTPDVVRRMVFETPELGVRDELVVELIPLDLKEGKAA